jgi:cell division protein FtsB
MLPMEWMLELVLVAMLAVTLFHAVRLERALGVLKRDRATLEALVSGFNDSTRQAEQGIERLRATADGAGRQIARQAEAATALKDDLAYLTERGERLADRLDGLVRAARPLAADAPAMASPPLTPSALAQPAMALAGGGETGETRLRSQAERDLLKALRMAR